MKRKYLAVTAFVAALLVVASGVAYAAHRFGGGMMKGHVVGFIEDALQKNPLTAQQKAAIEATLDKTIADVKSHKADRQAAMDEALTLFQADTLDTAALQALQTQHVQRFAAVVLPVIGEVHDVLSPAQRAELVQAVREHHAAMHGSSEK